MQTTDQAPQSPTNPTWSTLLLGWCAGLWSVWVVLHLFPFGQTNLTMALAVAGAAVLLLLAGWLLHGLRDTPSLACAMVFVCLVPWAMGAASLVLGMALGQHTGHWVAWGYVAASLVSAAAAFVSRQRILNLALRSVPLSKPSG